MDTHYLHHTEGPFHIRPQQNSLVLAELAFMNNTHEDEVFIGFFESLGNMELSSVGLLLKIGFLVGVLEVIEEPHEKVDALERGVAHTEDGADHLALHLAVHQDDVSFVLDHVAHLAPDLPDLRPQLEDYIVKHLPIPHAVNLGQHDDHWHLEGECDSEIIEDGLLDDAAFLRASLGIDHYEGVVREVNAETSDQRFGVSLIATHVDEGNYFGAFLHDLGPGETAELGEVGDLAIGVEAQDMLVGGGGLAIQDL
jgi:hypothetical protein